MSSENKQTVEMEGGIDVILNAMRLHKSNGGVQAKGCGALLHLAYNEENKKMIAKKNGIHTIREAMRLDVSNVELQKNAIGALWMYGLKG